MSTNDSADEILAIMSRRTPDDDVHEARLDSISEQLVDLAIVAMSAEQRGDSVTVLLATDVAMSLITTTLSRDDLYELLVKAARNGAQERTSRKDVA